MEAHSFKVTIQLSSFSVKSQNQEMQKVYLRSLSYIPYLNQVQTGQQTGPWFPVNETVKTIH